MKKKAILIILILIGFGLSTRPTWGEEKKEKKGGTLKRLSVIGDNMAMREEVLQAEAEIYKKAEEFINSPDIKQGLSKEFILERCGKPTAQAEEGARWVYKPPTSSYFKGEKICLVFGKDEKLLSWERILQ